MFNKGLLSATVMLIFTIGFAQAAVYAPVLKWQRGGCYASWCETGWYSSPATADVDGDGYMEVIASAYSIVALDGATGALKWRMNSGTDRSNPTQPNVGRTWPGIVVADVDGDGTQELVTAHGGGYVSVYSANGYFKSGWPKYLSVNEFRGLSAYDLDRDGKMEIIPTAAYGNKANTWVFEYDGTLRTGWPQLNNETGYAWGVYNSNAAVADLDGDGKGEVVVPSDVHYICTYKPTGIQVQANTLYGDKAWGKVGVAVDLTAELRGYVNCGTEHRPNLANSPATIADVNNDGVPEVVVTGNVYNCGTDPYTSLYEGVFIFNRDRTRFNQNGFNWEVVPAGMGAPLSEDYNVIENSMPNPVVVDIDGDGMKEILYPSYDGKLHCFWLDKTEKHNWPYAVYHAEEGVFRFASEPVVVDLDGDGKAEIIFGSWTQKGSNKVGRVHILDMYGNLLHEMDVPEAGDWNGILAAPTVADIDGDGSLELVVNTAHSGICAYDLPNTQDARILWGTGRGNYRRTGSNFGTSSLYAAFAGAGLWQWNGDEWSQLSPYGPTAMTAAGSLLYATFGNGIWMYSESAWSQLTPYSPEAMVASGSLLYGKYSNGIWQYNGSTWTQLTPYSPTDMVAAGSLLYGKYDNGIWQYNGSTWTQLTPYSPEAVVAAGSLLYGKYDNGIWQYNGSTWSQLTPYSPEAVVAAGSLLYGKYDNGIWQYNGSTWSQLTPYGPEAMVASGSLLYGDFGSTGIWMYNGSTWTQITPNDPASMVVDH